MRRTLGTVLTQVMVLSGSPTGQPGPADAITYVFGVPDPECSVRPRCPKCSVTTNCATLRPYVLVEEIARPYYPMNGIQIKGSLAAIGVWRADTAIPHRRLDLDVMSDAPRKVVTKITGMIVAAGRRAP